MHLVGPTKEHRHVSDRQVGAPIRDRKVQFLDLHEEKPPKRPVGKALTARMSIPILGSGRKFSSYDLILCCVYFFLLLIFAFT